MLKTSELQVRDIINVVDGRRLGVLGDLEIDLEGGRIAALVIPGAARFFGLFGRDRDIVIPWERILKIGVDVILVRLEEELGRPLRRPPGASRPGHAEEEREIW